MRALDEAGIEIPFPYRTLTFEPPCSWGSPKPPMAEFPRRRFQRLAARFAADARGDYAVATMRDLW